MSVSLKVDLPAHLDAKTIASKRPGTGVDGAEEFLEALINSAKPDADQKEKDAEMRKCMANFRIPPPTSYGDVFVVLKMEDGSQLVTSLFSELADTMKEFVADVSSTLEAYEDGKEIDTDVPPTLFSISVKTGALIPCDEALYQVIRKSGDVLEQQFALVDTRQDPATVCKQLSERIAAIYK